MDEALDVALQVEDHKPTMPHKVPRRKVELDRHLEVFRHSDGSFAPSWSCASEELKVVRCV